MSLFFKGIMVPVMTPFDENGKIDEKAFVRHIHFLVDSGVDSILVPSGTGEFANLSWEDRGRLTKLAARAVEGRIPVVALISDCSTENVLKLATIAEESGADQLMMTPPFFTYVDQRALLEMFTYVAERVNLPLWIYHQPGETKLVVEPDTVMKLSKHKNICGIKVAAGENFLYFCEITRLFRDNDEFSVLMGEDFATLPSYVVGGNGSVSSLANIVPKVFVDIWKAFNEGRTEESMEIQSKIIDFFEAFIMVSTGNYQSACKTILREMGFYRTNKVRAPFVSILKEEEVKIISLAKEFGLI